MTKTTYTAPALEKGLDILETLARAPEPLSLSALAGELGRSKSEIFRMVMVLRERGYVGRDAESEALFLTDRIFSLGLGAPRARDLVSVAVPLLDRLADATGHTLHLVVVHRGQTAVLAASSGDRDVRFALRLGFHRPALDATSGRVIIAFQNEAMRESMVRVAMPLLTVACDAESIARDLDGIRAKGFDLHESRDFVGLVDLCCPILDRQGDAVASVLMTCLRRVGQAEDSLLPQVAALQETCRAIAQGASLA